MPRRTSSRPKLLCTASALTIGVAAMSAVLAGRIQMRLHWERGRRVEGDEHPPEPLQRRQRQLTLGTSRKVPLHVVLAHGQDGRHDEVPDAGHDRQLYNVKIGVRDLLLTSEQLGHRRS